MSEVEDQCSEETTEGRDGTAEKRTVGMKN